MFDKAFSSENFQDLVCVAGGRRDTNEKERPLLMTVTAGCLDAYTCLSLYLVCLLQRVVCTECSRRFSVVDCSINHRRQV